MQAKISPHSSVGSSEGLRDGSCKLRGITQRQQRHEPVVKVRRGLFGGGVREFVSERESLVLTCCRFWRLSPVSGCGLWSVNGGAFKTRPWLEQIVVH
jgi:hypothetical protein